MNKFFKHMKMNAIIFFIGLYITTGIVTYLLILASNPAWMLTLPIFGFTTYLAISNYELVMQKIKEARLEAKENDND